LIFTVCGHVQCLPLEKCEFEGKVRKGFILTRLWKRTCRREDTARIEYGFCPNCVSYYHPWNTWGVDAILNFWEHKRSLGFEKAMDPSWVPRHFLLAKRNRLTPVFLPSACEFKTLKRAITAGGGRVHKEINRQVISTLEATLDWAQFHHPRRFLPPPPSIREVSRVDEQTLLDELARLDEAAKRDEEARLNEEIRQEEQARHDDEMRAWQAKEDERQNQIRLDEVAKRNRIWRGHKEPWNPNVDVYAWKRELDRETIGKQPQMYDDHNDEHRKDYQIHQETYDILVSRPKEQQKLYDSISSAASSGRGTRFATQSQLDEMRRGELEPPYEGLNGGPSDFPSQRQPDAAAPRPATAERVYKPYRPPLNHALSRSRLSPKKMKMLPEPEALFIGTSGGPSDFPSPTAAPSAPVHMPFRPPVHAFSHAIRTPGSAPLYEGHGYNSPDPPRLHELQSPVSSSPRPSTRGMSLAQVGLARKRELEAEFQELGIPPFPELPFRRFSGGVLDRSSADTEEYPDFFPDSKAKPHQRDHRSPPSALAARRGNTGPTALMTESHPDFQPKMVARLSEPFSPTDWPPAMLSEPLKPTGLSDPLEPSQSTPEEVASSSPFEPAAWSAARLGEHAEPRLSRPDELTKLFAPHVPSLSQTWSPARLSAPLEPIPSTTNGAALAEPSAAAARPATPQPSTLPTAVAQRSESEPDATIPRWSPPTSAPVLSNSESEFDDTKRGGVVVRSGPSWALQSALRRKGSVRRKETSPLQNKEAAATAVCFCKELERDECKCKESAEDPIWF